MDKIKELSIPTNARILVISDIHGELDLFKELLDKANFSNDDYLIVNGDLCEKGSNSMGVVSHIMGLATANPKVHVTEGNCDTIVEDLLAVRTDVSCAQLDVRKGDIVSIVDDSCGDYTLIKKDGEEGWVRKEALVE